MADVFNFLKPRADLSRNAFDLSQRHIFSAKCGQVLPVLAIDCIPGDYHDIDLLSLTRTFPVKTDAFTRMKQNFEFIYVPYQQLWRNWNDFILQNQESFSSYPRSDTFDSMKHAPCICLTDLLVAILKMHEDYINNTTSGSRPELWLDMFRYDPSENALRMLDLLGYGSFYWILKEYSDTTLSAVTQHIVAEYGPTIINHGTFEADIDNAVKVNLWRALAYQKACNDFYRSQQYTDAMPDLFNADYVPVPSSQGVVNHEIIASMFAHMWYRMYKKDMFTASMPSPQFGEVSAVDLGQFSIINSNPSSVTNTAFVAGLNLGSDAGKLYPNGYPQNSLWTSSAQIDVYQLRKAEALQKWKEDRLRAGNKNKNISQVIFGTTSRYLSDKYADFIKGFDGNMSIDEVVNMTASSEYELGDLAGKSVGSCNGHITYKCEEFGVLLCLYSVTPIADYDAVGLDKNNTLLEPFDYFEPHFENLGFDGIYAYQLFNGVIQGQDIPSVDTPEQVLAYRRRTLGYAPRFLNYKTAVDKVHGEFMSTSYVRGTDPETDYDYDASGQFVNWVTPRTDIENHALTQGFTTDFLYCNPSVLDPIFKLQADSTQGTDQFLCNVNFKVNSVRNLSVLGLPRW